MTESPVELFEARVRKRAVKTAANPFHPINHRFKNGPQDGGSFSSISPITSVDLTPSFPTLPHLALKVLLICQAKFL